MRLGVVAAAGLMAAAAFQVRPPTIAGTTFERQVAPFAVTRANGRAYALPFLGGLDVPRPQFTDIDGDGDLDLFVQEYSNALMFFENTGSPTASRYEWRSDRFQDLAIGEWYRFVDLDADGLIDLLSESPISHIRFYRNTGSKSAAAFTSMGELRDGTGEPMFMDRQNVPAIGDLDCDGLLDMLVGRVEGVVDRYEAVSPRAPQFALLAARYEGIEIIGGIGGGFGMPSLRHGANALSLADFDGDRDLDLFWGDFFEPAVLLIENVGRTCSQPSFQVDPIVLPFARETRTSGYNVPAPADVDGDGDMDFLMGVIGGAFNPIKTSEDNFLFWERTAPKAFELRTRRFLDGLDFTSDAAPAVADIDRDGDDDLIVGGKINAQTSAAGPIYILRNDGTRTAPRFTEAEPLLLIDAFNLAPAAGDLDADGDVDLLIGTWNKDIVYARNDGTAKSPRWVVDDAGTIRPPRASHMMPALADIDADGDLDLFVGQASGALLFYRNTGSARRAQFTLVSERLDDIRAGRRSAPAIVDVNGDGLLDLVLGHEEPGQLAVFRNTGSRTSPKFAPADPINLPMPPTAAPAFADINGDGTIDLFVGTASGGLRFYRGRRPAG